MKKWTMKDGSKISIKDMGDNHLINTINFLIRQAERKRMAATAFYLTCTPPTGDMAMDCFDQEFENVTNSSYYDYLPPIYDDMEAEAMKRGIDERIKKVSAEDELCHDVFMLQKVIKPTTARRGK